MGDAGEKCACCAGEQGAKRDPPADGGGQGRLHTGGTLACSLRMYELLNVRGCKAGGYLLP